MTLLQVMADNDPADVRLRSWDFQLIRSELASRGIAFDRWPVLERVGGDIVALYGDQIAALNAGRQYRFIDVAQMADEDPKAAAVARERFRNEHRHAENEVRFFAAGRACFYLHLDGEVAALVCESGDLLSVPAGTQHWFDMGARPDFVAVRFFERADGWVGEFSGDPIGQRFPTLDELMVL
ncbi:1,2-dihydroxy-3-keto-5-methylthiopentene dioxygenase [Mycolicibacter minnesotensis]